ncbi:ABC transporter permease [Salininema proteolyticum]|uniref:ABC transporter permease n=1 Tax=Salininema proteolyticum TaxID=1607685 RepID=A0ABV8U266_9ACTN
MIATFRLALRLALREAARNKTRTALTIAMLVLPLAVVSFAATTWATFDNSPAEEARLTLGDTDALITSTPYKATDKQDGTSFDSGYTQAGPEHGLTPEQRRTQLEEIFPAIERITPYDPYSGGDLGRVEHGEEVLDATAYAYDLDDPLLNRGPFEITEGTAPDRSGEVAVSRSVAREFDLRPGSKIRYGQGKTLDEYTVTAVVERPSALYENFVFGPHDFSAEVGDPVIPSWLVDLSTPVTDEDLENLNSHGYTAYSPAISSAAEAAGGDDGGGDSRSVIAAILLATFAVIEVVLLAGPAYTIGVKRRIRDYAVMSANGATPRQLRWAVLTSGLVSGAVAAVIGLLLGSGLALAIVSLSEEWFGRRAASIDFWPSLQATAVVAAIGTGMLASLTAAVSASRVNVAAAVSGHMTQPKVKRLWLFAGLAVVAVGMIAGVVGMTVDIVVLSMVGIVAVQFGLIGCTPSIVSGVGRLASRLPVTPRIALRETARNRSTAAPAVTAIMAVVGAGLLISSFAAANAARDTGIWTEPAEDNVLSIYIAKNSGDPERVGDYSKEEYGAVRDEVRDIVRQVVPDAEFTPDRNFVVCAPPGEGYTAQCNVEVSVPSANMCPWDVPNLDSLTDEEQAQALDDPRCRMTERDVYNPGEHAVTDSRALLGLETGLEGAVLDRAFEALEDGKAVVSNEQLVEDGRITLTLDQTTYPDDDPESEGVQEQRPFTLDAAVFPDADLSTTTFAVSPATLDGLGLETETPTNEIALSSEAIDQGSADEINDRLDRAGYSYTDEGWQASVYSPAPSGLSAPNAYVLLAALACGLIALGATAVATGLVVIESRRNLATLGAVGSSPLMRRNLSMWQAASISAIGTGIGCVVGFAGYGVLVGILNAQAESRYPIQTPYPFHVPWVFIGTTAVAVPLIAMAAAWVLTRTQIPSERRVG